MPASWSSPSPSSRSEQSMPCDSTLRILATVMRRPPGSTAPGGAKAARTPAATLGAPQATAKRSRPVLTRQRTTRWAPSSRSIAPIRPTATPDRSAGLSGVMPVPSMPAFIRRSAACGGVRSRSTNSRTHLYGIFMPRPAIAMPGAVSTPPASISMWSAWPPRCPDGDVGAGSTGGGRAPPVRQQPVEPRARARWDPRLECADRVAGARNASRRERCRTGGASRPGPVLPAPGCSCELPQEAQVVLEEQADVVDAVLEHRDALAAQAERPAGDLFGIVADVPEHLRVHHPGAQDLEPAVLADAAAAATAEEAEHVDLGGRLREREKRRAEADARPRPEHFASEEFQRPFEVRHRHLAVDRQPLDLVEHRRVRDVRIAAIDPAGADDTDRRALGLHGADLHGGGVGAQERVFREVEGVLHVPRGMILGDVQGLEVEVVALDLRPLGDGKAEAHEDRNDLVLHPGERVARAQRRTTAGEREVEALPGALLPALGLAPLGQLQLEQGLQLTLDLIGGRADERALLLRQRAQGAQQKRQRPLPSQVTDAELLQLCRRPRAGNGCTRFVGDGIDARMPHLKLGGGLGIGGGLPGPPPDPPPNRLRPPNPRPGAPHHTPPPIGPTQTRHQARPPSLPRGRRAWRNPPGRGAPARPGSCGRGGSRRS